jgi:hypothetical protein
MPVALLSEDQEDEHAADDDVYVPAVRVHPVANLWREKLGKQ